MANALSPNVIGANGRITVGLVLTKLWCDTYHLVFDLVQDRKKGQQCHVAGIASLSKTSRERARDLLEMPECVLYEDYRELLQNDKIDAVVCALEDFWHAPVILNALAAGKHVYINPPLCRHLPEALLIWDACKRSNKILQVAVQGCSDPKWHKAADLIQTGAIGPMVMAQTSYMRNSPQGEWNLSLANLGNEQDLNWKRWTRNIADAPEQYSQEDFFRWYKYYRYSSGLLAKCLPHKLHPLLIALGNPGFPVRVAAVGNNKFNTDTKTPGARKREVPEIFQAIAEMPGGGCLHFVSSSVNEYGAPDIIRGHHGSLILTGNDIRLRAEPAFSGQIKDEHLGPFAPESTAAHFQNWLESIRGHQKPNCGIELAVRAQVLICLAEMSERLNTMCLFDETTRRATDGFGNEIKPLVTL